MISHGIFTGLVWLGFISSEAKKVYILIYIYILIIFIIICTRFIIFKYILHVYLIYIYIYNYHLYADDLQIYTLFPSSGDSDLIPMAMFNCITDITEWFSHNSLSLNMTKTDTIIFFKPSSPLSITHPFLLSLPTS